MTNTVNEGEVDDNSYNECRKLNHQVTPNILNYYKT